MQLYIIKQCDCGAYKKQNMLYNNYGDYMKEFKIPSNPPTINKTIRFPGDVIDGVNKAIKGKHCTFTAFVVEAVRGALENLSESEE